MLSRFITSKAWCFLGLLPIILIPFVTLFLGTFLSSGILYDANMDTFVTLCVIALLINVIILTPFGLGITNTVIEVHETHPHLVTPYEHQLIAVIIIGLVLSTLPLLNLTYLFFQL